MPKMMSLPDEIAKLTEAIKDDPTSLRQYVTRLPVPVAMKFVLDCVDHEELPSNGLRRIVETHYEQREKSIALDLGEYHRKLMDAYCRRTGLGREEIVRSLIDKYLQVELRAVNQAMRELDDEPEPAVVKG